MADWGYGVSAGCSMSSVGLLIGSGWPHIAVRWELE